MNARGYLRVMFAVDDLDDLDERAGARRRSVAGITADQRGPTMTFVQIIEFKTSKYDEIEKIMEEWLAATEGKRTSTHSLSCRDRDNDGVYVQIVEFPSFEVAMANSDMPETGEFAQRMADLCDGPATFRNLDVLRDESM